MIMINKIYDKASAHTHIYICAVAVPSRFSYSLQLLFLSRVKTLLHCCGCYECFLFVHSSSPREWKKAIKILMVFNFIYFFKLKISQTQNLFYFAQNFHLLDDFATAARKADCIFIYLMPLN